MKAGFAKIQINVNKKLELTGFKRGRFANKTLDGIFCKAILLEDHKRLRLLFLSIDILFVGKQLSEKIKKKIQLSLKIPLENIILSATHTHSSPKTCESFLDGIKIDKKFFNDIVDKSCKAADFAFKMKSYAKAELFQISDYPAINRRIIVPWILKFYPYYFNKKCVNRPNRKVSSDTLCQGIKFTLADQSCFWLFNAAAHASNYNGNEISSDYPYYIEKNLIKMSYKNNCLGSLFLQGWSGDQNCDLTKDIKISINPISLLEKVFFKQTFNRSSNRKNLENIGIRIAKSLLKANKTKVALKIKKIKSKKIKLSLIDNKNTYLSLKYFDLGDIKIFGLNGEVFSSYRKYLLNILKHSNSSSIFTIGYLDDPVGYLPDSFALKIGGYETDRSISYFGLSSRFKDSIEKKITSSLKNII